MVQIRFEPSGRTVEVPEGTRLYDAVVRARLPIAAACGAGGTCGRCGLQVLAGRLSEETAHEARVKADNRRRPDLRLACLATVEEGPMVVTATYW